MEVNAKDICCPRKRMDIQDHNNVPGLLRCNE